MTDKQDNPYKATILLPETAFPMRGDLPKREPDTLARWEADGLYAGIRAHGAQRLLQVGVTLPTDGRVTGGGCDEVEQHAQLLQVEQRQAQRH